MLQILTIFFFRYADHRYLLVLTHSFPTRRSSYLRHRGSSSCFGTSRSTRTAMLPFLRPMRPLNIGTSPQRRSTSPSGWVFSMSREPTRSEEHTSEIQSPMRNSYAVFCYKKTKYKKHIHI